ncbi:DUF4190 domain-containing protein [Micromonospora inositola]|uniref:DUF4190 domain-containing protein n=1 Tax=Micromonospora inositola TaxID=47865 RepID=A0A1C5HDI5_9ACTN|nr:DUF4190 domain-containing protein [Micromonospora inositola]SCG44065.1 protein of unknown function [Micromonospora inositola]
MSYPPPSGGWHDPSAPGQQSTPPADPTLAMGGSPIPAQPTSADPYAPVYPYAGTPGGQPMADPYAAAGYPPPAYPGYGYPAPAKTNTMAIVALVLSLVGFASCITAPVGAILGHVARKQIRETGEQGEGMAKAAIIVGWILTGLLALLIAFYIVVIVIAIANGDSSSSSTF